jgi:hypothetical protein
VYVLSQTAPPAPDAISLSRHIIRRARMLPGKIIRNGPRALARIGRRSVKWVLLSTVPWALSARYGPEKKR